MRPLVGDKKQRYRGCGRETRKHGMIITEALTRYLLELQHFYVIHVQEHQLRVHLIETSLRRTDGQRRTQKIRTTNVHAAMRLWMCTCDTSSTARFAMRQTATWITSPLADSCCTRRSARELPLYKSSYSNTPIPFYVLHPWNAPHHHNRFTALFLGPPGSASARRELLDCMVQGRED